MESRLRRKIFWGGLISLALTSLILLPGLALIGDVDLNNRIDLADLSGIAQRLGLTSSSPEYRRETDLNLDNAINVRDLAIAGRSFGAQRIFHFVRQISNCDGCAVYQDSCVDGLGQVNIIWRDSSRVLFSRLDRFGNTPIDDVQLAGSNTTRVGVGCDSMEMPIWSGNATDRCIRRALTAGGIR